MKRLVIFFRWLIGPSMTILIEVLHVRLLNVWIRTSPPAFIHPNCTWKLADGHVCPGNHQGRDFSDTTSGKLTAPTRNGTKLSVKSLVLKLVAS
ncbi:hypothetical protein WBJ53_32180 (plasmid) [Spirosoma sp. SC4-14]|uniref:hypothetical protein n=1 Tax=Spirosoma sp. SC4-14 TaxID=3128900 RepID=UPI0030D530A6